VPLKEPVFESGKVSMTCRGTMAGLKSSTNPVGVPVPEVAATVPLTFTAAPCATLTAAPVPSVKVVVVARAAVVAEVHFANSWVTFTEPKPVARS
jgi:hypothetical protein